MLLNHNILQVIQAIMSYSFLNSVCLNKAVDLEGFRYSSYFISCVTT